MDFPMLDTTYKNPLKRKIGLEIKTVPPCSLFRLGVVQRSQLASPQPSHNFSAAQELKLAPASPVPP